MDNGLSPVRLMYDDRSIHILILHILIFTKYAHALTTILNFWWSDECIDLKFFKCIYYNKKICNNFVVCILRKIVKKIKEKQQFLCKINF